MTNWTVNSIDVSKPRNVDEGGTHACTWDFNGLVLHCRACDETFCDIVIASSVADHHLPLPRSSLLPFELESQGEGNTTCWPHTGDNDDRAR